MKIQSVQQVKKVLTIYQHQFLKTQRRLSVKKQSLREVQQRLDEKCNAIDQIENRLDQLQKTLVLSGQLPQWQDYQQHFKSQRRLIGQLSSQKSKLEIQVAIAQMAVEKVIKKLHVIKHKCEIIANLEKRARHDAVIKINEFDDELTVEQWQLAQPTLA